MTGHCEISSVPDELEDERQEIIEQGIRNWQFGIYPHHPEHPCFRCALVREALGRPPLVPILARRVIP